MFDDGRSIRSSIWEVTWYEDHAEVILSGDEQIILYFDGKKERKQLTSCQNVIGFSFLPGFFVISDLFPTTMYLLIL